MTLLAPSLGETRGLSTGDGRAPRGTFPLCRMSTRNASPNGNGELGAAIAQPAVGPSSSRNCIGSSSAPPRPR